MLKATKEIWNSLFVLYEGMKDVELRKIVTLTTHHECFSKKEGETIDEMFGRFQLLLNGLEALEHVYSKAQVNLKIIDNLPNEWEPKITAISEARNIKALSWDEFLGILHVHEVYLQNRDQLPLKDFPTLKYRETSSKKEEKKSFTQALKVKIIKSKASYDSSIGSTNDEVTLMSRNFKKILKRKEDTSTTPERKT